MKSLVSFRCWISVWRELNSKHSGPRRLELTESKQFWLWLLLPHLFNLGFKQLNVLNFALGFWSQSEVYLENLKIPAKKAVLSCSFVLALWCCSDRASSQIVGFTNSGVGSWKFYLTIKFSTLEVAMYPLGKQKQLDSLPCIFREPDPLRRGNTVFLTDPLHQSPGINFFYLQWLL